MIHAAPLCGPLPVSAAFVVGMAGSVHCVAMCGGLSGALALRARRATTPRRAVMLTVCNQAGRLSSYALAGALVGACGGLLTNMLDISHLALLARVGAGLVLLAIGAGVLSGRRPMARLERFGGGLWRRLAPRARSLPATGLTASLVLGMLWGWMPCGYVYSMLIFAALKGGAIQGAAMMLAFGLGTAPAVLGAGLLSVHTSRIAMSRGIHYAAGCLLLVFGVLTIWGPLEMLHG